MSRKDYNALADAISTERAVLATIDDVARTIAAVCAADNPRFDPRPIPDRLRGAAMISCADPCSPAEECYCRRVNAARGGTPTAYVEQEPVCCIDCGEPLCGDEPIRCEYCVQHALDLATIPDSPVPYGR